MVTTLLRRRGAGLVVVLALLVGAFGTALPLPVVTSGDGRVATVAATVDHGVAVVADGVRTHPLGALLVLGVVLAAVAAAAATRWHSGSVRLFAGGAPAPERRWWARKVGAPPVGWC